MSENIAEPLLKWYDKNKRILPWRDKDNAYYTWVSEIMLQQTRVEAVKPYFQRFIQELPDVAALAAAPEERIIKLWEGLGYYSRARNLQKAAKIIAEKQDGRFPEAFDDILALPGIGCYTAGAIASICFCTSGVSTQPGQMVLAVIPVRAVSSASDFVKPTTPCLAAT